MRQLDYGHSPYKPLIVRTEIALARGGRALRRHWRFIAILSLASAAVIVLSIALAFHVTHLPTEVASFAGPTGIKGEYHLVYASRGSLTLHRADGTRLATARDYYGDPYPAQIEWPTLDRIVVTMKDGTVIEMDTRGGAKVLRPGPRRP